MEQLKLYLKDTYELSNYQIAQIAFLFKTLGSELSKMILMGIFFHNKITYYLFALLIMLLIRSFMGGIHFYTYLQCLAGSTLYLWLAIYALPQISLPKYLQIAAMLLCVLICNYIGPITSKYRPKSCKERFPLFMKIANVVLFAYTLILYILPEQDYLYVGFWVVILHSLQLILAKIKKKGETKT